MQNSVPSTNEGPRKVVLPPTIPADPQSLPSSTDKDAKSVLVTKLKDQLAKLIDEKKAILMEILAKILAAKEAGVYQLSNQNDDQWASEIIPGFLWLGGAEDANNLEQLHEHGITDILNVSDDILNYFEGLNEFVYLKLNVKDHGEDEGISRVFADAISFIREVLEKDGKVLVHCRHGQNRSATIVMAFLMDVMEMKLKEAVMVIRNVRPSVCPFRDNRAELVKYEVILYGVSSLSIDDFVVAKLADKYNASVAAKQLAAQNASQNVGVETKNTMESDSSNSFNIHKSDDDELTSPLGQTYRPRDLSSSCDNGKCFRFPVVQSNENMSLDRSMLNFTHVVYDRQASPNQLKKSSEILDVTRGVLEASQEVVPADFIDHMPSFEDPAMSVGGGQQTLSDTTGYVFSWETCCQPAQSLQASC